MIADFVEFCYRLFPSIDPYTKEQAKLCMKQFENANGALLTSMYNESLDLTQGDVFSEIPFFYIDKIGQQKMIKCKAQLLSNTCDAVRDDTLIFAALHPLSVFASNNAMIDSIKHNQCYSALYLSDYPISDEYVDLEMINTISREAFVSSLEDGKVRRIASLTQVGYYMFLCKLTVFLMRPEDVEVNSDRPVGI